MKTVQERLGHSDVVITLKLYSHVLPTTQREAMRKLESLYSGRLPAQRAVRRESVDQAGRLEGF